MKINDFVNSDHISSELSAYIVEHFNPLYATTVQIVQLPEGQNNLMAVVGQGYSPFDLLAESPLPPTMIETTTIDLIRFGTSEGERVRAGYSAENNVLYVNMASYEYPQSPLPYILVKKPASLVWHINPDESIWSYGDRMFETNGSVAYIDNPHKRRSYQVAVAKRLKGKLTSLIRLRKT